MWFTCTGFHELDCVLLFSVLLSFCLLSTFCLVLFSMRLCVWYTRSSIFNFLANYLLSQELRTFPVLITPLARKSVVSHPWRYLGFLFVSVQTVSFFYASFTVILLEFHILNHSFWIVHCWTFWNLIWNLFLPSTKQYNVLSLFVAFKVCIYLIHLNVLMIFLLPMVLKIAFFLSFSVYSVFHWV